MQSINRISATRLLSPEDLKPSRDDFDVVGVFNPGAARIDEEIVLLVRVAERCRERRPGFIGLPRWGPDGQLAVDWESEQALERADPRIVRRQVDHSIRLTSLSHLRVFRSSDRGGRPNGRQAPCSCPLCRWKNLASKIHGSRQLREPIGSPTPPCLDMGWQPHWRLPATSSHSSDTA